jgi:hypothetical protein
MGSVAARGRRAAAGTITRRLARRGRGPGDGRLGRGPDAFLFACNSPTGTCLGAISIVSVDAQGKALVFQQSHDDANTLRLLSYFRSSRRLIRRLIHRPKSDCYGPYEAGPCGQISAAARPKRSARDPGRAVAYGAISPRGSRRPGGVRPARAVDVPLALRLGCLDAAPKDPRIEARRREVLASAAAGQS